MACRRGAFRQRCAKLCKSQNLYVPPARSPRFSGQAGSTQPAPGVPAALLIFLDHSAPITTYNSDNFPRPAEEAREDEMQKQRYREISWPAVAALALVAFAVTLGSLAAGQSESKAQAPSAEKAQTKVVLLGTGTPRPYPDRSGPATAIVAGARAYLVDFGPGVVRRAAAAAEKGTPELESTKLKIAFLTHLHSDHTAGYPDLILTPWVMGRTELDVY